MPDLIRLDEIPWEPFGGQTRGVFRKSLSAMAFPSGFKASLFMVNPGGEFPGHVDPYTHIFYILEGEAEMFLGEEKISAKKGAALTVVAGKKHGYRNPGQTDLLFITLNIFEGGEK